MNDHPNNWNEDPRPGIRDLWNSKLYKGADWTDLDNPKVHCTAEKLPDAIIPWHDAKRLHKTRIASGEKNYHVNAFIHCCIDDQKFDGEREGIWRRWDFFYQVASHFDGITGVDFSTNADFPEPVKRHQFHKMRAIEHGAIYRGIPVIPNVRWGTSETWDYCYDALPESEILCVGVVGSGLRNVENRPVFDAGLRELVRRKATRSIIVIGSKNYPIFEEIEGEGVGVRQYDGATCACFKSRESADV